MGDASRRQTERETKRDTRKERMQKGTSKGGARLRGRAGEFQREGNREKMIDRIEEIGVQREREK